MEDNININKPNVLSWEDIVARDKLTVERICSDDNFAYYFIYVACEPLLKKISWTIFKNNVDYDEIANELYIHLKRPNKDGIFWHNLKTFDYRTSLFDWIKTVAIRLFVKINNEPLFIPKELVENGVITDITFKLDKAFDRKLVTQFIIEGKTPEDLCNQFDIPQSSLQTKIYSLIRKIRSLILKFYPEYESLLFPKQNDFKGNEMSDSTSDSVDGKIDIASLISLMPNKRYQYVLQRLYLEEVEPDQLATELDTPVTNIYNLKLRALDQLRDVVILSQELPCINKYINFMSNDRLKDIATSLLVKGESYEEIDIKYNLSQSELKKIKKQILSELKKLIYTKDS